MNGSGPAKSQICRDEGKTFLSFGTHNCYSTYCMVSGKMGIPKFSFDHFDGFLFFWTWKMDTNTRIDSAPLAYESNGV